MTAPMPAITVYQPLASLIVLGVKPWETRPSPPNGDMRPAGVRGLPGRAINRGDRIAIHAAARWAPDQPRPKLYAYDEHDGVLIPRHPHSAIVATARVADVLPIVEDADDQPDEPALIETSPGRSRLVLFPEGDADGIDITDQLPYGDWTPGRWAWQLADIEACDPIPAKGRQGVWTWTP